jgi:hypothetical protein
MKTTHKTREVSGYMTVITVGIVTLSTGTAKFVYTYI